MGFNNPLTGENGALIYQRIKSPDYVAGSAGWSINKDGSAEFNNGVFRGSVAIGNSEEVLIYSSAVPAAGTLLVALAGKAGTDDFGNAFPEGLSISMGGVQIVLGVLNGSALLYGSTGRAAILNSGAIEAFVDGVGTAARDAWQFIGAEDSTQLDGVGQIAYSSSADGSVQAMLNQFYKDPSGVFHTLLQLGYGGVNVVAGSIAAVQPGTGTGRGNVAVAEGWNAAVLGSGWGPNGSNFPVSYRATPDGMLEINGNCLSTASNPAAVVFTIPTLWRPAHTTRISVGGFNQTTGNPETDYSVNVSSTGAVTINGPSPTAANVEMHFAHRVRLV